jgi:uncharacterized protein
VHKFLYALRMSQPSVTTIADARDGLSRVLRRFREGEREPVVIGSHRRPEAVIVAFDEFTRGTASAAPTLEALRSKRRLIMRLAELSKLGHVRVIGSVARGEATAQSDIDLLVDASADASLLDLAQFADDLEQLLGHPVDVISARSLDAKRDRAMLADAIAL